jgi:hypothetical protein
MKSLIPCGEIWKLYGNKIAFILSKYYYLYFKNDMPDNFYERYNLVSFLISKSRFCSNLFDRVNTSMNVIDILISIESLGCCIIENSISRNLNNQYLYIYYLFFYRTCITIMYKNWMFIIKYVHNIQGKVFWLFKMSDKHLVFLNLIIIVFIFVF